MADSTANTPAQQLAEALSTMMTTLSAQQPDIKPFVSTLSADSIAQLITYLCTPDTEICNVMLSVVTAVVTAYNNRPQPTSNSAYAATKSSSSKVVSINRDTFSVSTITELVDYDGSISYLFERRDGHVVLASRTELASRALTKEEADGRNDKWLRGLL